jgi:hypothetical protein
MAPSPEFGNPELREADIPALPCFPKPFFFRSNPARVSPGKRWSWA